MLVLKRQLDEGVRIGSDITVRVLGIEVNVTPDGNDIRVKLGIQAPDDVDIRREETITTEAPPAA